MIREKGTGLLPILIKAVLVVPIMGAILFISAGSLHWVMAWLYLGVAFMNTLLVLPFMDSGLIEERTSLKEGCKKWDIVLSFIVGRIGMLAILIVAGLNVRFGWWPVLERHIPYIGMFVLILGVLIADRAILENPFFSAIVRIQKDRGHSVISTGPYRFVRHPGYAGLILSTLAAPVMLGSVWALIPAIITIFFVIIRIHFEDRTLQDELDGYREYASKVRYRVMPGIW